MLILFPMEKEILFNKVIEYFEKAMPVAETELQYKTPYELLVAVILSAQCTDKRVNIITPSFFKRFPTAEKLSKADLPDVYEIIKSWCYTRKVSRKV